MADVEAIQEQVAGVRAVAPQAQSSGLAVRNAANWQTHGQRHHLAILHRPAMGADRRPHLDRGRGAGGQGGLHHRHHRPAEPVPAARSRSASASASATSRCEVIGTLASRGQGGFAGPGRRRHHADQGGAAPLLRQSRHPLHHGRGRRRLRDRSRSSRRSRACCASGATSAAASRTISTSSTPSRSPRRCRARPGS